MFIYNKYYHSFNFKNKINIQSGFFKFNAKNNSLTIHNLLFLTSLHYTFYFYTHVFYKTNLYSNINLDKNLPNFFNNKLLLRLIPIN